jgi:hypothetical protein
VVVDLLGKILSLSLRIEATVFKEGKRRGVVPFQRRIIFNPVVTVVVILRLQ